MITKDDLKRLMAEINKFYCQSLTKHLTVFLL